MGDAFKDAGPGERSVYDRTGLPDVHVLPEAMTDWAEKVLEGVPRHSLDFCDRIEIDKDGVWMHVDDVLAAIAKLGAGDGLVERLNRADEYEPLGHDGWEAAAHIAALTAQNREMALDVLASSGQAQEAYAAQLAAEAECDALRAKVARLEEALTQIAEEASAPVYTWKNGINFKKMYEGWRKIATKRIDIARAALTDGGKDE